MNIHCGFTSTFSQINHICNTTPYVRGCYICLDLPINLFYQGSVSGWEKFPLILIASRQPLRPASYAVRTQCKWLSQEANHLSLFYILYVVHVI